jgi:C4-dicarboxylate-specific signal transduction histidine kinase
VESLRLRAEQAGVRLRVLDEAGERPWLMAPEAVRDCLLNLALNALEALEGAEGTGGADIPDGGWGEIWLSVGKEGRDLVYRVRDNGPGLTATPDGPEGCFHSTKSRGNGIGLFATRRTAREMRAEFGFNPDCRQGTEAYLRLPAGI